MHDARAIANFFLDQALLEQRPLTSMTLLKVLYFAHAWFLAKNDRALVAQPFEAWRYGPVNRVVYDQIRSFGAKPITTKLISFDVKVANFVETKYDLNAELFRFLRDVYRFYAEFHAFHLSDLTHEEGGPWEQVWIKAETQAVPGMIIPNELIKKWFRESGKRQLKLLC